MCCWGKLCDNRILYYQKNITIPIWNCFGELIYTPFSLSSINIWWSVIEFGTIKYFVSFSVDIWCWWQSAGVKLIQKNKDSLGTLDIKQTTIEKQVSMTRKCHRPTHGIARYEIWEGSGSVVECLIDSRPMGCRFQSHQGHCVVSFSKNIKPSLLLVQPRKTRPFITERLLMGRKESNETNKKQDMK